MGSSEAVWAWRKREQNFRMLANYNLLASWIPDPATTGREERGLNAAN